MYPKLYVSHYYPVVVAVIYSLTLPEMIIGKLFNVWLAAVSAVLLFLIMREIGISRRKSFFSSLLIGIYPSYLYFGSLLLREALVVSLAMAGLLAIIKIIKKFSWGKFSLLYVLLIILTHFRFYIGYAMLGSVILSLVFIKDLKPRKKIIYSLIIIFLLGFIPQIASSQGYYGIKSFYNFLQPEDTVLSQSNGATDFIKSLFSSFIHIFLGPFPWQIKHLNQLFSLIEVIPWYFLLFFIIKGMMRQWKRYETFFPIVIFSIFVILALSLFSDNLGEYMRIRIPAFVSLFAIFPLGIMGVENDKTADLKKRIKVCHISSVDMTMKFLLRDQLLFFRKNGFDVYAVCFFGKWEGDLKKEGIKTKSINFKRKISPINDLIVFFKLFFYFRKEKFQIIHTHTPKAGFLGQLAAKAAGVPVIINTIHGFYFDERSSFLKRSFYISLEKLAAECSDLIFFQSREDMQAAIKEKICPAQKIRYLGNGVDIEKFNIKRFSGEFIAAKKNELNLKSDTKIIGIVGRLVEEKGYLDLFEAFKAVLNKFPEIILLIIGPEEPGKKDAVDKNIISEYGMEKNVIFLGERADVDEIYPLMDVFILPSHREGFPRTVIEAMAMSKPIIATNIRGCREAIENNKTGILIPEKNSSKLAGAIIFLLENPQKSRELGENARVKSEKEFNEQIIFNRTIKEYYFFCGKNNNNLEPGIISINKADKKDFDDIIKIRAKEIGKGFINKLGNQFLRLYYDAMTSSPYSFLFVAKEGGSVIGFISGCINLKKFYKYFLRKYFLKIFFVSFLKILNPVNAKKILETKKYPEIKDKNLPVAELTGIAVLDKFKGKGAAQNLFKKFLLEMRKRGVKEFKVVVGENLNRAVKFYEKQGFVFYSYIYLHKNMRSKIFTYKILN